MIGTVVAVTPSGLAFVRPDGENSNILARKDTFHRCGFDLQAGDRVSCRIARERDGRLLITKIEPA